VDDDLLGVLDVPMLDLLFDLFVLLDVADLLDLDVPNAEDLDCDLRSVLLVAELLLVSPL